MSLKLEGEGIEVWRQCGRRFDPDTARAQANGIAGLLRRPRAKGLQDLANAIERWENEVRNYETRTGDIIQDTVKTQNQELVSKQKKLEIKTKIYADKVHQLEEVNDDLY